MIAVSTITCPACGTSKEETMPTDACQFFHECTGCRTILRPKPGDCTASTSVDAALRLVRTPDAIRPR